MVYIARPPAWYDLWRVCIPTKKIMVTFLICLLAGFVAATFAVSACMIAARADERMAQMSHQEK